MISNPYGRTARGGGMVDVNEKDRAAPRARSYRVAMSLYTGFFHSLLYYAHPSAIFERKRADAPRKTPQNGKATLRASDGTDANGASGPTKASAARIYVMLAILAAAGGYLLLSRPTATRTVVDAQGQEIQVSADLSQREIDEIRNMPSDSLPAPKPVK